MEISCPIIKDLLPSYVENLCSDESARQIEAHIAGCADCAAVLENMKKNDAIPFLPDENAAKAKEPLKRIARKTRTRVLRAVALTILIIVVGIPLMYMTVAQVIGEGFTYTAAAASLQAHRYLRCIEDGEYEKAANMIDFCLSSEINENDTDPNKPNIPAARRQYAEDVAAYCKESNLSSYYYDVHFITDDAFTTGSASFVLQKNKGNYGISNDYMIHFAIPKGWGGKIAVVRFDDNSIAEDMPSAKQLSDLLATYDPG